MCVLLLFSSPHLTSFSLFIRFYGASTDILIDGMFAILVPLGLSPLLLKLLLSERKALQSGLVPPKSASFSKETAHACSLPSRVM